ncbi:MAG: hypothetical protein MJZ66_10265 [Bacteroidales bacterium]|nr:hypothetical protein [Bacteroidales bacterium]
MKYPIISIFLMLVLLAPSIDAEGQGDPYCHVEVVSGSPAFFQFNTVNEMTTGKSLYYSSCLRISYLKEPDKWELMALAESQLFEGNDEIDCQVIKITVEKVILNSPSAPPLDHDPKYGVEYGYCKDRPITNSENPICNGWLNHTNRNDNFSFYVYIKFSITPGTPEREQLVNKKEGYYLNNVKFYVKSTYQ